MTKDLKPEIDRQPSTDALDGIDIYLQNAGQDIPDKERPKQVAALLRRWKDHVKTILSTNPHDLSAD